MRKPRLIINPSDLLELAKELRVRPDWHEPDEQGVTARVAGEVFDNAGFWGDGHSGVDEELHVNIYKGNHVVAQVNLATLCAWATEYARTLELAPAGVPAAPTYINPNQHCNEDDCVYTFSHTARWCRVPQTKRCPCPYDYPS